MINERRQVKIRLVFLLLVHQNNDNSFVEIWCIYMAVPIVGECVLDVPTMCSSRRAWLWLWLKYKVSDSLHHKIYLIGLNRCVDNYEELNDINNNKSIQSAKSIVSVIFISCYRFRFQILVTVGNGWRKTGTERKSPRNSSTWVDIGSNYLVWCSTWVDIGSNFVWCFHRNSFLKRAASSKNIKCWANNEKQHKS